MVWLVLGMTIAVVLAAFVVGVVAIPARRAGRFVLTPRGEQAFRVADERARAARSKVTRRANAADAPKSTVEGSQDQGVAASPSRPRADREESVITKTAAANEPMKKRKFRKK